MKTHAVPVAILLALSAAPALAQTGPDFPRGKISGYIFSDWYENLAGNPAHNYDANGNDLGQANIDGKNVITKDLNGFQIRRAYFQLDNDLSAKYATRFRLEADNKSLTSDGKDGVAVKAAYLQAKNVYPRGDFLVGIVSTPMFEVWEDFWGFRAIEKTEADFRGLAPSADQGAELKGFVDANHVFGYTAFVGNGAGQKPETNRQKRTALALPVRWKDLHVQPYVDYEAVHGGRDRATYELFAGYDLLKGSVGWEFVDQDQHVPAAKSVEPRGQSLFARYAYRSDLGGFLRFDYWAPDNNAGKRVDQEFWIAGIDWQPTKDVHVMPNLEAMEYRARGGAVEPAHHDLQARITFYYKFSKPAN